MQTSSQSQSSSPSVTQLKYRPELDGLRALALVLVMGFHAQVPGFEAGFLGVDLFCSQWLPNHSLDLLSSSCGYF